MFSLRANLNRSKAKSDRRSLETHSAADAAAAADVAVP
jgi:hypothetical protein